MKKKIFLLALKIFFIKFKFIFIAFLLYKMSKFSITTKEYIDFFTSRDRREQLLKLNKIKLL